MITIYHNPRCSKSREGLALVEKFSSDRQVAVTIVEYLKSPLSLAQLLMLHQQLGGPVRAMVRDNEPEFDALGLTDSADDELLQALVANPKLLQRPIVEWKGRAVIGRPPERIHDLLNER